MNLKEVLEKAQKQVLDDESIKKEILKYVDDEDLYPALLELAKREVKLINFEFETNYKLEINCYPKIKETNIRLLKRNDKFSRYYSIGKFEYTDDKFVVKPHNDKEYGGYTDTTRENLIEMKNVLKMLSENFIINLVANKLKSLL